nr:reverse transcriptase domain, reverse transcriptase zinc-binding domain protein [Tanacetum cinerariifolium]
MPIDTNKPPDPLVDEFCILTKMTSLEDVSFDAVKDTKVNVVKGKPHKPYWGRSIKLSNLGSSSASAGSILKRICSSKVSGKARDRVESSPCDNRGGKRVISNFDSIDNVINCLLNEDSDNNSLSPSNDGLFIKEPLCHVNDSIKNLDFESLVAIGSDSTTPAKTGIDFEFRKWIALKISSDNRRFEQCNSNAGNRFGSKIMSNQYSAVADSFVKKLKQGYEEMALKMEYVPSSVSKLDNGGRRISLTAEEVIKGDADSGKLEFARVLVEFSVVDDLPSVLEIAYPPIGNSSTKIGRLDVKYQWKPPLCTHCHTVGHSTMSCKDDDGFVIVGKKNKPIEKKSMPLNTDSQMKQGFRVQNNGGFNSSRQFGSGFSYYKDEAVPISNSFEILSTEAMNEEFDFVIWPKLKGEVNDLKENDPSYEDEEDDVNFEVDGILTRLLIRIKLSNFYEMIIMALKIYTVDRRSLWTDLKIYKGLVKDRLWVILGDFNACLEPSKRSSGSLKITSAMIDFRDCVVDINVEDIAMTKLNFTWNKKPDVLVMLRINNAKPKPFKFHNYLTAKEDFIPVIRKVWSNKKSLREEELRVLKAYKAALKDEEFFNANVQSGMAGSRYRGPAKCAFKIDIKKAYDTVEWDLLSCTLKQFRFPELLVKWIMNCVTSTSFTVNVNGDHTGFFRGMRGLRQGDPLSPYIFMIVMKVFNLVLRRQIDKNQYFIFHWQYKELKLTHLYFTDDLLLFCNGDSCSVAVLKNVLTEFRGLSGLLPNLFKSTIFFGYVREASRLRILKLMSFRVGFLPVRYFGVPLISKRLYIKDCQLLIDKARKRLLDWKSKSLSFASRLQLIMYVVSSMKIYWASVFILPSAIANDIEKLLRNFLWNYGVFKGVRLRKIFASGLPLSCKVADVIKNGEWDWLVVISNTFDALSVIPPNVMQDKPDVAMFLNVDMMMDHSFKIWAVDLFMKCGPVWKTSVLYTIFFIARV